MKKFFFEMALIVIIIFSINSTYFQDTLPHQVLSTDSYNANSIWDWVQVIGNEGGTYPSGFGLSSNIATRGIGIYDGELYIGTQNLDIAKLSRFNLKFWASIGLINYHLFEPRGQNTILLKLINSVLPLHGLFNEGCEVWKYNYSLDNWTPVVGNEPGSVLPSGFGNHNNFAASIITSYKGKLYFGTGTNSLHGCEIWRWDGIKFEKVVEDGFGDRYNSGVWCTAEFNDGLYMGTMNWNTGCQIWKTSDGLNWIKVPLPHGDGFGTHWNVYAWSMGIYNSSLFVGTCNINRSRGCQLWKYDGGQWTKMNLPGGDGFGDPNNYGIRNLVEFNNELYVSSSTSYVHSHVACEIWKFDGKQWFPVIGDDVGSELGDGFGTLYNKYAWSMINTSNNHLLVGTSNLQPLLEGIPFNTSGCEIWCYDGVNWTNLVGKNSNDGTEGGFGNILNIGARSLIEYPEGSNIVWVGTWNMDVENFKTFNGCEIWKGILHNVGNK